MTRPDDRCAAPLIPVSWGELIDKITILEIKREKIRSPDARMNVVRELDRLSAYLNAEPAPLGQAAALKASLREVNEALWAVEDDIREKERLGEFDGAFISLARSVYRLNDRRAELKRIINVQLRSDLVEEKSYDQWDV